MLKETLDFTAQTEDSFIRRNEIFTFLVEKFNIPRVLPNIARIQMILHVGSFILKKIEIFLFPYGVWVNMIVLLKSK